MNPACIVGLGEVLWDMLPNGARLGGAPANFAVACGRLGLRAAVASAVGKDNLGIKTMAALSANGVMCEYLQTNNLPTSEVIVKLDADGHGTYTIEQPVAWDGLAWNENWAMLAEKPDALCFGTLGQRSEQSRETIQQFVAATRPDCVRVFDVNLRNDFWSNETLAWGMKHATIVKLNEEELPVVLRACGIARQVDESAGAMALLSANSHLELVCVTLGSRGCLLTTPEQQLMRTGFPAMVVDTVGAGDAFTAGLVTYWLKRAPLHGIAAAANRLGSYVASQHGAMPHLPVELLQQLDRLALDSMPAADAFAGAR